jgi:hypothetical protein
MALAEVNAIPQFDFSLHGSLVYTIIGQGNPNVCSFFEQKPAISGANGKLRTND